MSVVLVMEGHQNLVNIAGFVDVVLSINDPIFYILTPRSKLTSDVICIYFYGISPISSDMQKKVNLILGNFPLQCDT
jgi:hypothetical protein